MKHVCDAGPKTWFRIETVAEAMLESQLMRHAVERYFRQMHEAAARSYVPPKTVRMVEQSIGLKDHIQRTMPLFLTLRDGEGNGLATAMLPPGGKDDGATRPIIVGPENSDPFPQHAAAIAALARHYGIKLEPSGVYPFVRR